MALSDLEPDAWLKRLIKGHDLELRHLREMDHYYEGTQPLSYMHPDLVRELEDRVRQVVINWPRLIVDSLENRLTIEGFRYGAKQDADQDLWKIFQANDGDEMSSMAHVDALALSRSFLIVGTNPNSDQIPLITAESALQVHGERDPQTRLLRAAVKRWSDDATAEAGKADRATLYLPGLTVQYAKTKGKWEEQSRDAHGVQDMLVLLLANRGRLRNSLGVSELKDVIPLSDAACKIATDMMVSAEFHAMPRRYAIGMGPEDFVDEAGNPISAWRQLAGRIWTTGEVADGEKIELGQFPEAELSNFHNTLNLLARLTASLSALPPSALGLATDNPPSADAIRAAESQLVKRAERKQSAFGEVWERAMRLALQIRDGKPDPEAASMETIWREASTPTIAQQADAAQKLFGAGISTRRQAREDVGYSAKQIERMEEDDAKEAATDPLLAHLTRPVTPPVPAPSASGG